MKVQIDQTTQCFKIIQSSGSQGWSIGSARVKTSNTEPYHTRGSFAQSLPPVVCPPAFLFVTLLTINHLNHQPIAVCATQTNEHACPHPSPRSAFGLSTASSSRPFAFLPRTRQSRHNAWRWRKHYLVVSVFGSPSVPRGFWMEHDAVQRRLKLLPTLLDRW